MEEEIFKKCIILPEKLLEFGFVKEENILVFKQKILNDEFTLIISYDGKIKGRVMDNLANEEYINYRIEEYNGEFVNKIRNKVTNLLEQIKSKCTIKNYFLSNQANRITNIIYNLYHDNPLFLWDDENAVFKNSNNNKWYGIIMQINKNKISSEDKIIEVINVKLPINKIKELLNKEGYYPAYHMNKKYWITISLDETLKDENIISLIEISHEYTINSWLMPISMTEFDIVSYFDNKEILEWKKQNKVLENDFVYIYSNDCILYKCRVISSNNDQITLERIKSFATNKYSLKELNKYGIKNVNGIRKLSSRIVELMEE